MFNLPPIELPDPNRPRYTPLATGSFPAASLGAWLDLAREAGVAMVPAERVATLSVADLLNFEEAHKDPAAQETLGELDRVNASLGEGEMLRWDCCAGFETKSGMSEGIVPEGSSRHLSPGEPRTFDLLYDFPADQIAIWKRPWIPAKTMDGFPVEFRVFISEGKVAGIANYYLQRDLPDQPEIRRLAASALSSSQAILDTLLGKGISPRMPNAQDLPEGREGVHATLDFLATETGELLLLEGGPGFGFGAHPCAFLNGREVDPIEGLKLASGASAIPLNELNSKPTPGASRSPSP